MLSTTSLPAPLPMAEWRKQSKELAAARKKAQPDANKVRAAWTAERLDDYEKRGVNVKRARQTLAAAIERRTLLSSFLLQTEKGETVSVAEVLADPKRYHETRFYDPLEPDYRGDSRIAYANLKAPTPYLWSWAHGGIRYSLSKKTGEIVIIKGERSRVVDDISGVIQEKEEMYQRGGDIVRIDDGEIVRMCPDSLAYYIGHNVDLLRPRQNGEDLALERADVPSEVVNQVLATRGAGLRRLERVVDQPTLRMDGSILATPGYDAETGVYLLGGNYPQTHEKPTEGQLYKAFDTINWPFRHFPFSSIYDKGVFVATLLAAVARHLLPTMPATAFDSSTPGSGKSLLGFCVQVIAGGSPGVESFPDSESEMNNGLVSVLRSGKVVQFYDNVDGEFGSNTLETFLTSPVYHGRVFYSQEKPPFSNNIVILLSGNNMVPRKALYRRVLMCRIEPGIEAPESRSFDLHPVEWCKKHRQEIVAAALTLWRGYFEAGCPQDRSAAPFGSFERWNQLVRHAVLWLKNEGIAELGDPCRCIQSTKANEPERAALRAILHAAYDWRGSDAWRVRDLIDHAKIGSELLDVLMEIAPGRQATKGVDLVTLGKWLGAHRERRVDGLYIERHEYVGSTKAAIRWRVCSKDSENATPNYGKFSEQSECDHSGRVH